MRSNNYVDHSWFDCSIILNLLLSDAGTSHTLAGWGGGFFPVAVLRCHRHHRHYIVLSSNLAASFHELLIAIESNLHPSISHSPPAIIVSDAGHGSSFSASQRMSHSRSRRSLSPPWPPSLPRHYLLYLIRHVLREATADSRELEIATTHTQFPPSLPSQAVISRS